MTDRVIGIPSRFALFLCGLISVALSRVHFSLRGLDRTSHWAFSSAVLMLLGGVTVIVALVPGSWVAKAFRSEPRKGSSVPLKMLVGFAIASYLVIVALSFLHGPSSPRLVFLLCPACALTVLTDPSSETVFLLLAPLSAAIYGALGGMVGYVWVLSKKAT
jgi:hypothetical protein